MNEITKAKEKAIEQFEYAIDLIKQDGKDYLDERDIPILNMAIKALAQEPKTEKFMMRDATPEEQKSVDNYIKSISKPTGVNFWTLEQEPSGDLVSRQTVKRQMIKYGFHAIDMTVTEFVEDLPPVNLQEPILDKIRAEIEQLPIKTRINWDGCCPDIDYPEIEYVDVSKNYLLSIIDKYRVER